MPKKVIKITEPEHFAFNFIGNNEGKGIPAPLPNTVRMLMKKGLIKTGEFLPCECKIRCWLTDVGKTCFRQVRKETVV